VTRTFRPWLAALIVLAIGLTTLPARAESGSGPSPFWVANYLPSLLWSGVDNQAVSFGALAQFTPLLAVGVAGTRLLVLNPTTEGLAYVDAGSTGPVGAPFPAVLFMAADGSRRLVHVELAQTPDEWERGLMGRQSLPADSGMLFVFPEGETVGFWMKDTPLPLSIAFIDDVGNVLSVQDMQPFSTDSHFSPAPYHYALEVRQLYFAAHGIAAGATAVVTLPSS
jgi:uncharacterized membrane protein (UPF0127 family)